MTSPPRTPNAYTTSMQPSPCEPTYTAATYKPPSLYPNKKQRTDFVLEPVPPINAASNFTSPALPSAGFEPNLRSSSMNAKYSIPPPSIQPHPSASRRQSVQHPDHFQRARTPMASAQHRQSTYYVDGASPNAYQSNLAQHYRTRESIPTPCTAERNYRRMHPTNDAFHSRESYDTNVQIPERPAPRRSATHGYDSPYARNAEGSQERRTSQQFDTRYEQVRYVERERGPQSPRREQYSQQLPKLTPGQYQSHQNSYFMPSPYDHQHGRTRKRSNLPKQATEIMKTWFDQVFVEPLFAS